MRILGIDPSYVCTGFAIIEDRELLYSTSITFKKYKTKKEKRKVLRQMVKRIENRFLPDKIVVERTRLHSRGFISMRTIIALGSLISAIIDASNCNIYSVDSRSFKSKVIGSANCSKKDTVNWAKLVYQVDVDEDQADAIAIGLYPFMLAPLLRKEND